MEFEVPFLHYRICNASFAVLTGDAAVYQSACEAADRLAMSGFHLGVVWLNAEYPPSRLLPVANLLHPLQACVIVDGAQGARLTELAEGVLEMARADGTSPWRGRVPRLVSVRTPAVEAASAMNLVSLARGLANHTVSDGHLLAPLPSSRPDEASASANRPRRREVATSRAAAAVAGAVA